MFDIAHLQPFLIGFLVVAGVSSALAIVSLARVATGRLA